MDRQQQTSNRRALSRYRLNLDVDVVDEMTGRVLGKLADLHFEGLMVISSQRIDADRLYQVQLQPRCPEQDLEPIALGIDCIWSDSREQEFGSWAGFQIIDASQQALEQLHQLIDMFAEPDA